MATYVNDLRLKEIATGDEAGTWGTSTNTNLELIGEALGYGTQDCFASDADATTTVADGATDPARAMYFKVTSSATLTATRTLTIAPNTISRVMLIENATTGSQSITISQGSGSTVTIASGAVKMVYLDGAGAGGAVVEALADLELPTVTVADLTATTADLNGGTIDGTVIGGTTAAAITGTTITGTSFVSSGDMTFGDSDKAIFGAGSDLQIYHDGSNSYVQDAGTGSLNIKSNGAFIDIQSDSTRINNAANNEIMATFVANGAVTAYYDNSAKLSTTSTGIDVTGTATADKVTIGTSSASNAKLTLEGVDGGDSAGIYFNNTTATNGKSYSLSSGNSGEFMLYDRTSSAYRLFVSSAGNISFYEDTGTTPKFSWSSANETISIGTGASSTATISAYSRTVSASLPSALRIIENTGASSYWDIGSTGGASNNLNFYANANTTPKVTFTGAGNVDVAGTVTADGLVVSAPSGDTPASIVTTTAGSFLEFTDVNTTAGRSPLVGAITDDLVFYTSAGSYSRKMTLTASGNVGIGTSSPTANLVVTQSGNTPTSGFSSSQWQGCFVNTGTTTSIARVGIYSGNATTALLNFGDADDADIGGLAYDNSDNSLAIRTNNAEAMRINSSGSVGIGTSSPSYPFHVTGSGDTVAAVTAGASSIAALNLGNSTNLADGGIRYDNGADALILRASNAERMRISSAGQLFLNVTAEVAAGYIASIKCAAGTGGVIIQNSNTTGVPLSFRDTSGGGIGSVSTTNTTTAYNTSSDQRLKENIADADDAGSKIDAIQVRQYDWKVDGSHQDYGMVAQELMTVAPEAVSGNPESDEMMGVDYSKLVPMMLKEIQSLRARVAQLEGAN
jgi:hypothetical protein